GSTNVTPRDRKSATLATVDGCVYIPASIAGATTTGQRAARTVTETGSSARPCASLARVFAVAGATTITSLSRPSVTWAMSVSMPGAHRSADTGRCVIA